MNTREFTSKLDKCYLKDLGDEYYLTDRGERYISDYDILELYEIHKRQIEKIESYIVSNEKVGRRMLLSTLQDLLWKEEKFKPKILDRIDSHGGDYKVIDSREMMLMEVYEALDFAVSEYLALVATYFPEKAMNDEYLDQLIEKRLKVSVFSDSYWKYASFKKRVAIKDIEDKRLPQPVIALIHFYKDIPIHKNNMDQIASEFEYTSPNSGAKLERIYNTLEKENERIGGGSKRGNTARDEYFKTVILYLKDDVKACQRATEDYQKFLEKNIVTDNH